MTETMANGYSFESTERELSNEYQHNRVLMVFKRIVSGGIFFDSDFLNILHFMAIETYIRHSNSNSNSNATYFVAKKQFSSGALAPTRQFSRTKCPK